MEQQQQQDRTPRPRATLRKEVVDTPTWGELIVCQVMATEAIFGTDDIDAPPDGETDGEKKKRLLRNIVRRDCELLAASVRGQKDGDLMYAATEWAEWMTTNWPEVKPVLNKALVLNGFPPIPEQPLKAGDEPEDPAKNA